MLFTADWDQDGVAQEQNFTRQILQALEAEYPDHFEQLLSACTPLQRDLLTKFTDGFSLEAVFEEFDFDSTRASREIFGHLKDARTRLLDLHDEIAADRDIGLVPKIRRFASKVGRRPKRGQVRSVGLYEDAEKQQPLLVSFQSLVAHKVLTLTIQGVCECRVHELGEHCQEHP